ncbi:MAG: integrase arm-type DNA-binding domain-containing protein [Rhodospirillaceae bacterium]
MKGKITRTLINEFLSNDKEQCLYDTQLTGLHVRKRGGRKGIYYLFYRNSAGIQRRPKIGFCNLLSPDQARAIAGKWLLEVASGGDPSEARKIERREAKLPSTRLIFGDVAQQYLENHLHVSAQQTGRKGTYKNYKGQIESHYFDVFI